MTRSRTLLLVMLMLLAGPSVRADEVIGFTLIDADSDASIGPLADGQVLDLDVLPTSDLAIRADTSPSTVGSVVFDLDAGAKTQTESVAPYALFGDSSGDFNPWSGIALVGPHTLSATAFTGGGGSGTPGSPFTINFTVVDPTPGNPGIFDWASRASAPVARFEAQGTAVGSGLYVIGGFFNGSLQVTADTHRYDAALDSWSQVADSPTELTHSPQTIDGDTLYLVGGFVGTHPGGSTDQVWAYDTDADQWIPSTSLPADRGGGGLARRGRTLHHFSGATRTEGINILTDHAEHWTLDLGPSESPLDDASTWVARAPLPNPRNHMAGFALNGVVYGIGGQHAGDEDDGNQVSVHAYDAGINAWAPVANLPLPLGHIAAGVVERNGRILVIGGVTTGSTKSAAVSSYDPTTDTWTALPPIPAERQSPVVGRIGDEIIVTGGSGAGIQITTWSGEFAGQWDVGPSLPVALGEVAGGIIGGTLYLVGEGNDATLAYDLATAAWETPGVRAQRPFTGHHHAAEVLGNKLYLIGGLGHGSEGQVQIYDPATNLWQVGSSAPFASGSGSSALIDGLIYYAGGIVGSSTTNQMAVYDPAADDWTPLAAMPVGVNHAAHATDGARLFIAGGRDGGNSVSNGFDTLQIYDPQTDSWTSSSTPGSALAALPQARGGTGQGVFFDGEFYVLGGETQNGPGATAQDVYDRVDVYDPITNTWRLANPIPTARHGIWPMIHAGRLYLAGGGVQKANSQSTAFETYHFESCGPDCSVESTLVLSGAPTGGSIWVDVGGVSTTVMTTPGQSLEEVADAVAEALHVASAGTISVQATQEKLVFEGLVLDGLSVDDPGLGISADPPISQSPPVPLSSPVARLVLGSFLLAAGYGARAQNLFLLESPTG